MLPVLFDFTVIFSLSLIVVAVGQRFGLPNIVAFLLTGVIAGPSLTGLVSDAARINSMADLGVTLLLFTIGIEFSVSNLLKLRIPALIGGPLQIGLTTLAIVVAGPWFNLGLAQCCVIGFAVAQSSTAIVIKLYQKTGEIDDPHSRAFLGVSIFQDISSVPILLAIPLLAGVSPVADSGAGGSTLHLMLTSLAVLAGLAIAAKWVVPGLLFQAAKFREDEMFLIVVVVVGFGIAFAFSVVGLSVALGAFFAGLIISQSGYGQRALASVLPFRDLFITLFFASIGMLLNLRLLIDQPLWLVGLLAAFTLLKFLAALVTVLILRIPLRTAILASVALAQIGEFSFVVLAGGQQFKVIDPELNQLLLGVAILSMIVAPFYVPLGGRVANWLERLPWPGRLRSGRLSLQDEVPVPSLADHLVIVGYGLTGQNLARAAKTADIPFIVVEMNPITVRRERAAGLNIIYGDASHEATLKHVNIEAARVVVLAISDAAATRRTTDAVRHLNPKAFLIVRTRYVSEVEALTRLGADEVIPEEYETAVEIFTRVLRRYLVPRDRIEQFVASIRSDSYGMLRNIAAGVLPLSGLKQMLGEMEIGSMVVGAQSRADGRTLGDLHLRRDHDVTVMAVKRGSDWMASPNGATRLAAGDVVLVSGLPEKLAAAADLFYVVTPKTDAAKSTYRSQVTIRSITRGYTRLLTPTTETPPLPPPPSQPDIP